MVSWGPESNTGLPPARKPGRYWWAVAVLACLGFVLAETMGSHGLAWRFALGLALACGAWVFGAGEAKKNRTLLSRRWVAAAVCVAASSVYFFVPAAAYVLGFFFLKRGDESNGNHTGTTHTDTAVTDSRPVGHAGGFLGYDDAGMLVTANPRGATLVIGPPGSGKTRGVVMNSVALAPAACVSTSIKTEVMAETHVVRGRYGRCWWFDPGGTNSAPPVGVEMMRWNPLCDVTDWSAALSVAARLTGPLRDGSRGGDSHWVDKAETWCAALLFAAVGDLRLWARWCRLGVQSLDEADNALDSLTVDMADSGFDGLAIARDVIAGLCATDDKELSGIASTLARIAKLYNNPAALAAGDNPNFDPHTFVRSADTLYISASTGDVKDYAPLLAGILESIRDAQEKRCQAVQLGHENQQQPVTFVLDEATNTAPIPLPAIASTAGGQGLHLVVAVQEPNQVRDRWGYAGDGFLTLFPEILVLSGMRDERWTQQISRMSGEYDRITKSVSTGQRSTHARPGFWFTLPTGISRSGPSESYQTQRTAQLSVSDVANVPAGRGLYLHQNGWQLLNLRFYTPPPLAAPKEQQANQASPATPVVDDVVDKQSVLTRPPRRIVAVLCAAAIIPIAAAFTIPQIIKWSTREKATPMQSMILQPPVSREWHWDRNWIRNYHQIQTDSQKIWVLHPALNGQYYLANKLVNPDDKDNWEHNANYVFRWPEAGAALAVLDPNEIMSTYNTYGDIELVGLRGSCRPGNGFQPGRIDKSCVMKPYLQGEE